MSRERCECTQTSCDCHADGKRCEQPATTWAWSKRGFDAHGVHYCQSCADAAIASDDYTEHWYDDEPRPTA